MAGNLINLPINIPWKQIAVSPDMMDEKFCNKLFPFAWRSSMAISAYEPDPADLPEELCGDRITYLKITTTITGYQPSEEETKWLDQLEENLLITFPDIPIEDLRNAINRIIDQYFACYGVLLNVAVFPYPNTKKELIERNRIDFSTLTRPGVTLIPIGPGEKLDNPYEHPTGVIFEATGQDQNRLVNNISLGEGTDAELDLHTEMVITIPATSGLAAIEAKVAYLNNAGVKMEAFRSGELVGTASSESEQGQVQTLLIEAQDIDKVVITSPENEASLLEFAYFVEKEVPIKLTEFPHIIDFEPKKRDLYQGATETGEILTASVSGVHTDKSFTHTQTSETGVAFSAKFGPPKVGGGYGGIQGEIEPKEEFTGTFSHKWGETDQDQTSIQRDASRERRETQGTTAQISQMYNLLTGYHVGTNRAAFLMLARPHVLQPTDFRTFVQGLRAIEGVQEFFLIVARPEGVEGLCIETSLETGHYPEDTPIIEPEEAYKEDHIDWLVIAKAKGAGLMPWSDPECVNLEEVSSATKLAPGGWVVDQREERKRQPGDPVGSGWDEGHHGLADLDQDDSPLPDQVNYQADDAGALISGKICGDDDFWTPGEDREFRRNFRLFIRSEQPVKTYQEPYADIGRLLITSRALCACFKSGDCLELVSPPVEPPPYVERIVGEPIVRMNKALLTSDSSNQSRLPAMKEFLQKIQTALATSFRSPKRYAFGDAGFLESDYLKDQIKKLLPDRHLKRPLGQVRGLPDGVIKALGEDITIGQALEIDLARFARSTGLSIKEAARARQQLLGLAGESEDDVSVEADQEYGNNSL